MKTYVSCLLALTASTSLFATLSCSDGSKEPAAKTVAVSLAPERAIPPAKIAVTPVAASSGTTAAYTPVTADLFGGISTALDNVTRDQTAELAPLQENLDRNLDAEIANWKAHGGNSTPMSEEHLALARTDLRQKVHALSLVDDETFRSAKENAISSLNNVRKAYGELLVSTDRN